MAVSIRSSIYLYKLKNKKKVLMFLQNGVGEAKIMTVLIGNFLILS